MKTVLFIKANDRPMERSVSVKMYDAFLRTYRGANPGDRIQEIDLFQESLPYLGSVMINANSKAARGLPLDPEEQSVRSVVEKHLVQFLAADKIVFAFPFWNLTLPAVLHTYLDYMHHPGKTFKYSEQGSIGLLSDKKAALLNARGGVYGKDNPAEMAVRFVRNHLNFFGITDITEVVIEGHHEFPARGASIIETGLEQVVRAAEVF